MAMKREEIMAMQRKIGVEADGFWGPKSQSACRIYLRRMMPNPNPWPESDQSSLRAFYGDPGDESELVKLTFPFPMFYEGRRVISTRCHRKVHDSLLRVLNSIGASYGAQRGIMEEAEDYGGVFNFRLKRGGSSYSLHAFGAAIDLDADDNTFKNSWPVNADMPLEIIECFAREGWVSGAAFWGYDAMHFQATQ
jgi:hypothetical protein